MLNAIPVFGWSISICMACSMAVPVWFCWTWCELGLTYGVGLPSCWKSIPFTHCVGLFVSVATVRSLIIPPRLDGTSNKD